MPTGPLPWERRLGRAPLAGCRTEFRCWAPAASDVRLRVGGREVPMEDAGLGVREVTTTAAAGEDYEFVLDGPPHPLAARGAAGAEPGRRPARVRVDGRRLRPAGARGRRRLRAARRH